MPESELQIEIYLNIFQRLGQPNLEECLSVCKKWNYYAAPFYYQNIVLTHCQIGQLSRLLKQHADSNISRWARKITFKRTYLRDRIAVTKRNFHEVLIHLPFLKIICLTDPERDLWYLKNLIDIDLNCLPYLNQININLNTIIPYTRNIFQLYYSNMARFKDSITHLQLIYLQPNVFKSCGSKDILSYLSQFTRLTHLKIFKPSFADTERPNLPDILKACNKNLQNLCLHDQRGRDDLVAPFLDHANHFPSRLSHIQLNLTHLFLPYIEYIIHHIPSHQLNMLCIEITDEFLTDWVTNSPSAIVDQFTTYLGLIENLTFNTGKNSFSRGTTLTKEAIPGCIGIIHSITNRIANKRPLFMEMKMVLNGTHRKPNTCIRVERNKRVQLKIIFQDPDWYPAEENIDIMDYIAINTDTWRVNVFQMIKSHLVSINPIDIYHIFSYIIAHCTHLHHFFITNSFESFAAGPSYCNNNQHRDTLNFEYISDLEKTEKIIDVSSLPPTNENLKYLSFENIRVTNGLLRILVQGLQVKTLRFSGCLFEKDINNNVSLTIGGHVSTLILNIDAKHYTFIFLEVEINDKCTYYQSQKKTMNAFELLPPSQSNYVYNRYSSKNTTVIRIQGAALNQIIITAEYVKKTHVTSKLYPRLF